MNHDCQYNKKVKPTSALLMITFLVLASVFVFAQKDQNYNSLFLTYPVDVSKQDLQMYWKDESGVNFSNFDNLKNSLLQKGKRLVFAMNGGMYKTDGAPLGLYIEKSKTLSKLNTLHGAGNFYLTPNGVFYITKDNKAAICPTQKFINKGNIKYATQSGPMLVVNGQINPVFQKGSANVNIRNAVGILPDGKALFVISKKEINFYDLAIYFKTMGCKDALYLDGFVSRAYLPEQNWIQLDGDFGVMIGVTTNLP